MLAGTVTCLRPEPRPSVRPFRIPAMEPSTTENWLPREAETTEEEKDEARAGQIFYRQSSHRGTHRLDGFADCRTIVPRGFIVRFDFN